MWCKSITLCTLAPQKKGGGEGGLKKKGEGGESLERCMQAINQIQLIRSADKISQVGLLLTDWKNSPEVGMLRKYST